MYSNVRRALGRIFSTSYTLLVLINPEVKSSSFSIVPSSRVEATPSRLDLMRLPACEMFSTLHQTCVFGVDRTSLGLHGSPQLSPGADVGAPCLDAPLLLADVLRRERGGDRGAAAARVSFVLLAFAVAMPLRRTSREVSEDVGDSSIASRGVVLLLPTTPVRLL